MTGTFPQRDTPPGGDLERTVHYRTRVGLDPVKHKLLDDGAGRQVHAPHPPFCHAARPESGADFESAQGNLRGLDPFNL